MIVPEFWAESRRQEKVDGRQVTVRRFGWSDRSHVDAQRLADERVNEAFRRITSGERVSRREPKVPYNGAEGVPIREEIVERHGEVIVTRNSYGARCLNTPDVLFADIDFGSEPSCILFAGIWLNYAVAAIALALWAKNWLLGVILIVASLILALITSRIVHWAYLSFQGGDETLARQRLETFVEQHPDWRLRLYRTPNGLRVLAMQRTFGPQEPAVAEFFAAVAVDPIFARMCLHQNCFRARVSPKPWRIGIGQHIQRGWPTTDPVRLSMRREWVQMYEQVAVDFASCQFIDEIGSGQKAPTVVEVQRLHDAMCQALSDLEIA